MLTNEEFKALLNKILEAYEKSGEETATKILSEAFKEQEAIITKKGLDALQEMALRM